jgi:hypothetical protein
VSHNPPFKSETKTWVADSSFDLFDFVPLRGPGGGRVVIDHFVLCVTGTITVGTLAWDGRDVIRLFKNIRCTQRDQRARWNLNGPKTRIASIYFNGIAKHQEHAAVAIGAGQVIDLRMIIPMAKPMVKRGKDFALASDVFEKFTLDTNSLAGAQTGTTVLTVPALSFYILAHWHEEHAVEIKAEDSVKSTDFTSTTQAKLALSGAVHDLFLVRDDGSAGGGAAITAITDARVEDLGTPTLTRQDLVHTYRTKRKITASGPTTPGTERFLEPVQEGKCLPILVADDQTSLWDGRVLPTMKIDVGTGAASLAAISREVLEKSQSNFNAQLARFKLNPAQGRMKTAGKSKRNLNEWSPREQLVGVWSYPLPKVA